MTATRTDAVDKEMRGVSPRESILASIRKNLAASGSLENTHAKSNVNDVLPRSETLSREALINVFKTNLESVGGHCYVVLNDSEASETVRKITLSLSATKVAISDSVLVASIASTLPGVEIVKNADPEYLFSSDVGITGAQWAIAETGTLVLESGAERHRLTSLIPPVHICILEADNIRHSMGEILEIVHGELSRTVTFITGASRTSDIELTLAIGVHGPRELHVIVIENHRP
jgi:L-lactate dehydrogenase complex protein LldG